VYCAAASYAAIRHAIRACCVTLTNGEPSSLQSFALGAERLVNGVARQVIVGGAEEISEIQALSIQASYRRRGDQAPLLGEGAALFTLETREEAQKRGARELAEVVASATVFTPDLQRGYEACVARIRRGVGDATFGAIAHVIGAGKRGLDERAPLSGDVTVHAIAPRLGYLGSATGAFGVAAALADRSIGAGSLVLVVGASDDGSASTVLFRKLANASEEAS
jgi:3-oxoacyl-[acyl-carrier-protein] synthase II